MKATILGNNYSFFAPVTKIPEGVAIAFKDFAWAPK
jgi:hypothetical protein